MNKECTKCKTPKAFEAYSSIRGKKRSICKECILKQKRDYHKRPEVALRRREYNRQWRIDNFDKFKEWETKNRRKVMLKSKYGISLKEYQAFLEKQGELCAICKTHQNHFKKPLYVDHCHNTKQVRGLLCQRCNSAIGLLDDNIVSLERAIKYLKKETK